jgi:hypothetical protein
MKAGVAEGELADDCPGSGWFSKQRKQNGLGSPVEKSITVVEGPGSNRTQ